MIRQINIIPAEDTDNYRDRCGYAWTVYDADPSKRIPGDDRRGGVRVYRAAVAELESAGIICINPRNTKVPDGAVIVARISCMWCGGADLIGYTLTAETDHEEKAIKAHKIDENPGEECHETAATVAMGQQVQQTINNEVFSGSFGWCPKCQTFCYGDCQS